MQVIIIGGGASGLMAAITAARNGRQVTLLERQARVGRKLLATGNGRCNLTNQNMGLPYYHGQARTLPVPLWRRWIWTPRWISFTVLVC